MAESDLDNKIIEVVEFSIGLLELKPNNLIILRAPESWSPREMRIFQEYFTAHMVAKNLLPEGTNFIVLPKEMDIEIIDYTKVTTI